MEKTLIELMQNRQPVVAMLAPSFPIVYQYPNIVGKLKRFGFHKVVEVAVGAAFTNKSVVEAIKNDPKSRFITSPCPSLVRMVRSKYPDLKKYLAFAADSPMVATARIVREKYPGSRPVFIGPCVAKKFEASEDYPELEMITITFKKLDEIFKQYNFQDDPSDLEAEFDLANPQTRLYPISGGLAQSSWIHNFLADDQIEVVSGWSQCQAAIQRFTESDRVRLLDILFCEGGCINGPGIVSDLPIEERREKIVDFWRQDFP